MIHGDLWYRRDASSNKAGEKARWPTKMHLPRLGVDGKPNGYAKCTSPPGIILDTSEATDKPGDEACIRCLRALRPGARST